MIKYDAPQHQIIEIAQAFDNPSRYYLNRPLIMLLEGLGVPYTVFELYQKEAIREAQQSVQSLEASAGLLNAHGLGASFRLSVVLNGLQKLGFNSLTDRFYLQMMRYSIHHVLREIKHK
jgi:RNA-dependent RNA polymerase